MVFIKEFEIEQGIVGAAAHVDDRDRRNKLSRQSVKACCHLYKKRGGYLLHRVGNITV